MKRICKTHVRLLILSISVVGVSICADAEAACTETNTCLGEGALPENSGINNSAFGAYTLNNTAASNYNTAVGADALSSFNHIDEADSSAQNTAVGGRALLGNLGGNSNSAFGFDALSGAFSEGEGYFQRGSFNTASGVNALEGNSSGNYNTASGAYALQGADTGPDGVYQTGSSNTASGAYALNGNRYGKENTANGAYALRGGLALSWSEDRNTPLQDGNYNTATGSRALLNNGEGSFNTAIGASSLRRNSTGIRNTAIGYRSGFSVTGNDNITIGGGNEGHTAENGVIRIGIASNQKKAFVAGIRGVTTGNTNATAVFIDGNGQLGTIKSSRTVKEDIQPLGDLSERLYSLRPVTFRYKQPYEDGSKPVQIGLVAEDVAEVFPELVVYGEKGKPETVSYHLLSTLLVNELQKQRAVVTDQEVRIADLERKVAELVKK